MGVNKDRKRYGCVGVVITLGMFLCACGKKEEEKNLGIGNLLVPTGNKPVQEESGTKENAVKAPEEVLSEQLVDATHDAFLVETGGRLGTVLITAESKEDETCVKFFVWDLSHMESPIQVIRSDNGYNRFGQHLTVDADFDGYQDFGYLEDIYEDKEYWDFWFWDEEQGKFESHLFGEAIFNPVFLEDTKMIYCLSKEQGIAKFYSWGEDGLSAVREVETRYSGEQAYFTVTDRLGDVWVRVFGHDYKKDSKEWEKQWNLWCDPAYYGEPESASYLLRKGLPEETAFAFVIDTGGAAGERLVTVQPCEISKDADIQCHGDGEIKISVWNPADISEPLQAMRKCVEKYHYQNGSCGQYEIVDANFDGYMDFAWLCHSGNQPRFYYLWLWNKDEQRFVEEPVYHEISSPFVDADRQIICGWNRNSAAADGDSTFYKWIDGEFSCVRKISVWQEFGSDNYIMTVENRLDGEMVEVYRREFKGFYEFDAEREKWSDLNYYGELL